MNERKNKLQRDEDFSLIKAFLGNSNDRAAFNKLVLKYRDSVYNLCYRLLGDYDEANDCAQEIFIKVFSNLKTFKFGSSFSTWLYRISVNTCKNNISSLSSRMKKKAVSLDCPLPVNESSWERNPGIKAGDNSFNPEKLYEKKERETIIQNAVDSLKSREKILIVLRDIENKSYEEIVSITGLNMGTVKSRLARARQELREKLTGVM
ncbi:MAG: sigma-70 family RNA polymerase sigma factor [Spirochaetota bacterium]